MIRAPKRTWMKLTMVETGYSFWLGIEYDSVVAQHDEDGEMGMCIGFRADDTLSKFARSGWGVEGPFDAPE